MFLLQTLHSHPRHLRTTPSLKSLNFHTTWYDLCPFSTECLTLTLCLLSLIKNFSPLTSLSCIHFFTNSYSVITIYHTNYNTYRVKEGAINNYARKVCPKSYYTSFQSLARTPNCFVLTMASTTNRRLFWNFCTSSRKVELKSS